MNEILSRTEIEERFPGEWILLIDPDPGTDLNYRGHVAAHSSDRAEVYRVAFELRPKRSAFFFAGPAIPPGSKALL